MAKTYDIVPGNNPFEERGNDGYVVSRIDLGYAKEPFTRGEDTFDGKKFEVYMARPRVGDHDSIESLSEECQSFWGDQCDLQTVIDAGIAQFLTRPNYSLAKEKETEEERHQFAVELAADYEVGRKPQPGAAAATKKKATAYDALQKEAEELGMSIADIIAFAKENAA